MIDLRAKLIVFEGLDFTGKSTQVERLARRMRAVGLDVVTTGEPGGTKIGERVRQVLLSREHVDLLPLSELLLFMTSRTQVTHEVILPALKQGKTVVSSRYRLSSMAYQGYGRGLPLPLIRQLNEAATSGRLADITLLIDLPATLALTRKHGGHDRIEAEDAAFYERVRKGFLELTAADPTVMRIDGTGSVDEIEEAAARLLGL